MCKIYSNQMEWNKFEEQIWYSIEEWTCVLFLWIFMGRERCEQARDLNWRDWAANELPEILSFGESIQFIHKNCVWRVWRIVIGKKNDFYWNMFLLAVCLVNLI